MAYFSVEEMAQMLRRNEETIRRQIRSHQIAAEKVGRSWQISEQEIIRHRDAIEQSMKTFQRIAPQIDSAMQAAKDAKASLSQMNESSLAQIEATRKAVEQQMVPQITAALKIARELQERFRVEAKSVDMRSFAEEIKRINEMTKAATNIPLPITPPPFALQPPRHVETRPDETYHDPAITLAIAVSKAKQARNELAEAAANGELNALDYQRQIQPYIEVLREFADDIEKIGRQLSTLEEEDNKPPEFH